MAQWWHRTALTNNIEGATMHEPAHDKLGFPNEKKPYTKPALVVYGPVEKLTQSGSKAVGDSRRMMNCL
jgi:hypothetical protein